MFTKEQLAKWRSEGFEFDDFYDEVALEKKQKNIEEDYIISSFWSSDIQGRNKISRANLGNTVYFHINTRGIKDGNVIKLQLFDQDIFFDDNEFPVSETTGIADEEIVKHVVINNSRAVVKLNLEESWKSMIYNDDYYIIKSSSIKIELFWRATFDKYNKTLPAILNVYHSQRTLYFTPPVEGYKLPELFSSEGWTIITAIGDPRDTAMEILSEKLDDARFFIGMRALKRGKLLTNIGEVYNSKRKIYSYNLYTNEGELFKIERASNFGFKNIDVNNGKLVTTKGLSQIDYFSNRGVINGVAKMAKEILDLWPVTEIVESVYKDDYGSPDSIIGGVLPTAWSFASILLTELIIKPEFEKIIQNVKEYTREKFEIVKQKGLKECVLFENSVNKKVFNLNYKTIDTYTLGKLLRGDVSSINDLDEMNKELPIHTVFYIELYDNDRKEEIHIVDCIFVGDELLNYNGL